MTLTDVTQRILDWYAACARFMPWRGVLDPYAVWISEVMLQQTRVETVIPYYQRWMEKFPTVQALAGASQTEVLQVWEGLGYYGRARNLHKTAGIVVKEHQGHLPANVVLLKKLPGIGAYTAGAIASIAFGLDVPAVDGNIRRVLARLFNVDLTEDSTAGKRRFDQLATENLPPGRAGDYCQALMDLGAMVCTPRKPICQECPLGMVCQAFSLGIQEERPVNLPRPKIPHYIVAAAVIFRDEKVLITRRPQKGLLGGLWEFPGGKQEVGETLPETLMREIREEIGVGILVGEPFGIYIHAYTHFKVTLHAFICYLTEGELQLIQVQDLDWVIPEELANFPMGKIDRQISIRLRLSPPQ